MGQGMAIVTIGGLTYATLMTLFIIPVMYDIFFRRKIKVMMSEKMIGRKTNRMCQKREQMTVTCHLLLLNFVFRVISLLFYCWLCL